MSKATLEKKILLGVCLQFQEVVFDYHGKEYDTSRQGIEAVVENLSSSSVGNRVRERETCAHIQWYISPHKAILSPKKPYLIVFPK